MSLSSTVDAVLLDHDNNGSHDLVLVDGSTNRILRFPRSGPDTFGPPVTIVQASDTVNQLQVFDFNADGEEDLFVAGELGSTGFGSGGTWLLISSGEFFWPPMEIGPGGRIIELVDFEGDGDMDLFVGSSSDFVGTPISAAYLLTNIGLGQGFSSTFIATTFLDSDFAAGDTDADGFAELLISMRSSTMVETYSADAAGAFTRTHWASGSSSTTPHIELIDLDGDSDLDIALATGSFIPPRLDWVENLGTSLETFVKPFGPSAGGARLFARADFNGDGAMDLVGADGSSMVQVALTGPGGALSEMTLITGGWDRLGGALAFDADTDGDMDLAVYSERNGVGIAFNDGTGSFTPPVTIQGFSAGATPPVAALYSSDVDADGRADLLSVTATDRLLLTRQVAGGFAPSLDLGSAQFLAPRTVDIDQDGDLDIVAYQHDPWRLVLFEQVSPGTFSAPTDLVSLLRVPRTYEFRDMDSDGLVDLVTYEILTGYGVNSMLVYYGLAAGGFEPGVDVPLPTVMGLPAGQQVFDDLDGDGLSDLIYTNGQNATATVWWTRNLGGRQFAPAAVVGVVGSSIRRIELGQPVPGGAKALALTLKHGSSGERYRVVEVTPAITLGAADDLVVLGAGANAVFFADLGTGGQDVVITDGNINRLAVVYNNARRDVGVQYCGPAAPNSTGLSGEVTAFGSTDVASNELDLVATQLPAGSFAFFLASLDAGFAPNAGGSSGNLCLGGAVGRLIQPGFVGLSSPDGVFRRTVDLNAFPQPTGFVMVLPQSTWHFQAWHRDLSSGQSATSNFTSGVEVTFN